VFLSSVAASCGDDPAVDPGAADRPIAGSETPPSDRVVALVDGVAIGVDDVRDLIERADGGIDAGAALEALVSQELLAAEAERRGFGRRSEVTHEQRAALARALLDRRAQAITLDTIDGQLREVYESQLDRFVHGPKRRVVHALARTGKKRLTDEQAVELIGRVHEAVRDALTAEEFLAAARPLVAEHGKKKLRVEMLRPFHSASKRLAAPFVQTAFDLPGPGHVSEPFPTKFGWHVLLVIEELPPANVPFEEAREIVGAEVLPEERSESVDRLVEELRDKAGVFVYETGEPSGAGAR
jgi:hypothetical protein